MTGSIPPWAVNIARWSAISVGLGLIFAWFGVYETVQIPFWGRVGYWSLLIAIGSGTSLIITPLIFERWLAKAHPAIPIAVASAIISVPITIGIILIESASNGALTAPSWWMQQYVYVLVVSVILTTGAWAADRYNDKKVALATADAQPATSAGAPAGAAFTDRLPIKFRTALVYAVSAEDHYLRVHSSLGETMILMRLADAVRELSALEGLQTHRSWWVARQGLADAVRSEGKLTLKLKSGTDAPVSRTYLKTVKDAGWA